MKSTMKFWGVLKIQRGLPTLQYEMALVVFI